MSSHKVLAIVASGCVALLSGGISRAEEYATLPYRDICRGMSVDFSGDAAALPRELVLTVRSSLPTVSPQDIRFTLQGANEAHEISVSSEGTFKVPVSAALFDADAQLVSNQPRGTLRSRGEPLLTMQDIRVTLDPHLKDGRIDYRTLAELAIERRRQVTQELARQAHAEDDSPKVGDADHDWYLFLRANQGVDPAKAVIVSDSPPGDTGPIRSRARKLFGERSPLQEQSPGVFRIRYSDLLREQNPVISLSPDSSWFGEIGFVPKKPK